MADSTPVATPAKVKYRIKSGAKSVMYPGLAEYTQDHLSGEHAELIVTAMKKIDARLGKDNFSKLIEEVK